MSINVISEIGINHNGSVNLAKKLIDVAVIAGCNYVKFQKRNPDVCVPEHQKSKLKNTPWGEMTYLDYKKRIEFDFEQYFEIDSYCKQKGIMWFNSVWDEDSVDFMRNFESNIMKIPSALITNHDLCKYARNSCEKLIISTGMSNEQEIEDCINICDPDVIMHTNSSYPSKIDELNLNYITHLKEKYPNKEIGYSGHEYGLVTTFATVPMGVSWIERHSTLDRTMWGSDQLASVEPMGMIKLVQGVRAIEKALGEGGPRTVYGSEREKLLSLRN